MKMLNKAAERNEKFLGEDAEDTEIPEDESATYEEEIRGGQRQL